MAAGEMPALAELARRSARFRLDHGPAQRTGLAWEHVASGLSPDAGRRWSAVEFDPSGYTAWQEGARFVPWWSALDRRVVVFDAPYVDLRLRSQYARSRRLGRSRSRDPRGRVSGGAADGVRAPVRALPRPRMDVRTAVPLGVAHPGDGRGPLPRARRAHAGGAVAHDRGPRGLGPLPRGRGRGPRRDRRPVARGGPRPPAPRSSVGVGRESGARRHPPQPGSNARRARRRRRDGASIVAFTMGGMGPNHSDVSSMVLLPELLYRHAFGQPLLTVPQEWTSAPASVPVPREGERWFAPDRAWVPMPPETPEPPVSGALRSLARGLPRPVQTALKGVRDAATGRRAAGPPRPRLDLHWQPALRYRPHWPRMPAFALPSFYDGRIRINLRGRERHGLVDPSRYETDVRGARDAPARMPQPAHRRAGRRLLRARVDPGPAGHDRRPRPTSSSSGGASSPPSSIRAWA